MKLILEEINKDQIKKDVQAYVEKLNAYHLKRDKALGYTLDSSVFEAKFSPSWIKIISTTFGGKGQKSVHCFIDYEGNIYKSASWNTPAKGVRGTLYDKNPPLDGADFYRR